MRFAKLLACFLICGLTAGSGLAADQPAPRVSVLTGQQVIQILDETVDWYRTLGIQQQNATQPSDLLILFANRQTADQVIGLAFEIARANAELLSSEAGSAPAGDASSPQSPSLSSKPNWKRKRQFHSARDHRGSAKPLLARRQGRTSRSCRRSCLSCRANSAVADARRNLLDTMTEFRSTPATRRRRELMR